MINRSSRLSIVIATYNRGDSLLNCLKSLTRQTEKDFEVLIIDGGSMDETAGVIAKFKKRLRLRVLVDKTPHLAYIRDLGWREAKGEVIAWIDDDVVVEPQWAESIKHALQDRSVGGISGPTVIPADLISRRDVFFFHTTKNPIGKFFARLYFRLFMQGERYGIGKIYPSGAWSPGSNFPSSRELKKPIEVDYLEACNFAIHKKVLEEIGGYDLNYKDASEWCEVDLAFRIRKTGYKLLFDPSVAVEHHVSSTGVFTRRFNPVSRCGNFFRFYLFSYYPKTIRGIVLFFLYFKFLVVYYLYLTLFSKSK